MGEGLWLGVVTANAEIASHVGAAEARRTLRVCLAALFPKHFRVTANIDENPMSFALPADAARWRAKTREFVTTELQPFEVEAEMNEGRIPAEPASGMSKWRSTCGSR